MSETKMPIGYPLEVDPKRVKFVDTVLNRLKMRQPTELRGEGFKRIDMATGREVEKTNSRRAQA